MSGTRGDLYEDKFERLVLVVDAVWELLRDHAGLTNEDLFRRVNQIDLEDGVADGRRRPDVLICECGSRVNPASHRCDYCGTAAPVRTLFDLI